MKRLILIKLSALLIAGSIAEAIQAQAYCALRDPVRQIGELYPGHSYVSHVGVVTTAARKEVSNRLPFTLHFNELGSHTLYAVGKGDQSWLRSCASRDNSLGNNGDNVEFGRRFASAGLRIPTVP